jgi:hypothetical protein
MSESQLKFRTLTNEECIKLKIDVGFRLHNVPGNTWRELGWHEMSADKVRSMQVVVLFALPS